VHSFDRILVLERGRLVRDGSPDALLRRDGAYRRLIEAEVRRLDSPRVRAA
jgi:ABC-type multidrug transport system fused ATPase/permease subunit